MSRRSNPFDEIERLLDQMGRQIEGDLGQFGDIGGGINVDVEDRDDAFVVTADLPGYGRDGLDVEVLDETLRITASREEETEQGEGDGNYIRQERRHQSATRTVTLPGAVDEEGVSASYKNGVLTVTLPKRSEDGSSQQIDIE